MNLPQGWQDEVIRFWFEELEPASWFARDEHVDAQLRARFESLHDAVSRRDLEMALAGPRDALATVIVLDQFSRNLFRNSPRAFATDDMALAISRSAIERKWDLQLVPSQRMFLYMPFQHAEDMAIQDKSIELFTALGNAQAADYAGQHREVIRQFGRFPHRNAALGRKSTPAEVEFMQTHPGF
jgi:uncharacterized protein (DUF924 family)